MAQTPREVTEQLKKELTNVLRRYKICPDPCGSVTLHVTNGVVGTIETIAKVTIK